MFCAQLTAYCGSFCANAEAKAVTAASCELPCGKALIQFAAAVGSWRAHCRITWLIERDCAEASDKESDQFAAAAGSCPAHVRTTCPTGDRQPSTFSFAAASAADCGSFAAH